MFCKLNCSKALFISILFSLSLFCYYSLTDFTLIFGRIPFKNEYLKAMSHTVWLFSEIFGVISSIVFEIIRIVLTKKQQQAKDKRKVVSPNFVKIRTKQKQDDILLYYYLIFLSGFLSAFISLISYIFCLNFSPIIICIVGSFYFITSSFYCKVFLNYKFHNHHYLAYTLLFFSLVFIILTFSGLYYSIMQSFNIYNYFVFILLLAVPLREVIEKYLMETHFISPYRLICFESLTEAIILTLSLSIPQMSNQLINYDYKGLVQVSNNWFAFWKNLQLLWSFEYNYVFIVLLVNNNFMNIFRLLINQKFNANQRFIADNLCLIYAFILVFTQNQSVITLMFTIFNGIFLVINIAGNLIFTEVLVLNFCGLSKNVRIEILTRTEKEQEIMSLNNIDINSSIELHNN